MTTPTSAAQVPATYSGRFLLDTYLSRAFLSDILAIEREASDEAYRKGRRDALAELRQEVELRSVDFSLPDRKHRYRAGIHEDVNKCGECGRLNEDNDVLALIDKRIKAG